MLDHGTQYKCRVRLDLCDLHRLRAVVPFADFVRDDRYGDVVFDERCYATGNHRHGPRRCLVADRRAYFGGKDFQTQLDRSGSGAIRVFSPTTPGTYVLTVQDAGVRLNKVTVHVHG